MVAYAKAHRLSVQAFYRAKARLARYGAGQLSPLGSAFQRVEEVSAPIRLSSCRVHPPNAVVVELGIEEATLGRALQAAGGGRAVMMRPAPDLPVVYLCREAVVFRKRLHAPWRC